MQSLDKAEIDTTNMRRHLAIQDIEERLQAAAKAYKWPLLVVFLLSYLAATGYRATRKTLWYDEIFTATLSRLPDWSSLWGALMQGVDFNPPLFYLLTHGAERLAGAGPLGVRLPEVIGFGVFCLCLFRFVSLRTTVLGGLVAMIFPLCTSAYLYAFEARPHGVVIGCCGLAAVCWQGAASVASKRRVLWLVGLGTALAAAVLNHAYGVLVFVPLMMGELTRSILDRRVDRWMWLTILAALSACAAVIPLARRASAPEIMGDWGGRWYTTFDLAVVRVIDSYVWHFAPAAVVLIVALLALVLTNRKGRSALSAASRQERLSRPEIAVVGGLLLLPVFAAVLSLVTTSSLFERYSISVVGGVAVMLGLVAARRPVAGVLITTAMLVQIVASQMEYMRIDWMIEPSSKMRLSTHAPRVVEQLEVFDEPSYRNMPIALVDKLDFAALFWYAPPHLRARMTYLMAKKSDGLGRLYLRLQNCCGATGAVSNLADYGAGNRKFLIYGLARATYRLQEFADAGLPVTVIRASPNSFLGIVEH